MTKVYQGKEVTVLRDATASDEGFNTSNPDALHNQILIKLADGSQKVVMRQEVTSKQPTR